MQAGERKFGDPLDLLCSSVAAIIRMLSFPKQRAVPVQVAHEFCALCSSSSAPECGIFGFQVDNVLSSRVSSRILDVVSSRVLFCTIRLRDAG